MLPTRSAPDQPGTLAEQAVIETSFGEWLVRQTKPIHIREELPDGRRLHTRPYTPPQCQPTVIVKSESQAMGWPMPKCDRDWQYLVAKMFDGFEVEKVESPFTGPADATINAIPLDAVGVVDDRDCWHWLEPDDARVQVILCPLDDDELRRIRPLEVRRHVVTMEATP